MKPEFYQDSQGEWRWKVTARNNKVIDASSEGFSSEAKAKNNYYLGHESLRDSE